MFNDIVYVIVAPLSFIDGIDINDIVYVIVAPLSFIDGIDIVAPLNRIKRDG